MKPRLVTFLIAVFSLLGNLNSTCAQATTWFRSGGPTDSDGESLTDTKFWTVLDDLAGSPCDCFTLPEDIWALNNEMVTLLSTYSISIWGEDPVVPGTVQIDSTTNLADVYVAAQLNYSDNAGSYPQGVDESERQWLVDYVISSPFALLRRIDDVSTCPLDGMEGLWGVCNDLLGPFTDAEIETQNYPHAIPIAYAGGSSPIVLTNNWICHFSNVPMGKYVIYIGSTWFGNPAAGQTAETWDTNAASAIINVEPSLGNLHTAPYATLESPSNSAALPAGMATPIHFRLVTDKASVLSWKFFSVLVNGQILTNHFFSWDDHTTIIDQSINWTPVAPGTNIIQLYCNDTACDDQNDSSGVIRLAVNVVAPAGVSNYLQLAPLPPANHQLGFSLGGVVGQTYQLQYSPSLINPVWTNVGSPVVATNSAVAFQQIPATNVSGYYRVVLPPAGTTDWQSANLLFPAGTQAIKMHFNDPFTYSTNRYVRIDVRGTDSALGWGTWVYCDALNAESGLVNPPFYLAGGSGIGVVPLSGLPALQPGVVYSGIIGCDQVGTPDFFGYDGYDGSMVIDEPGSLANGLAQWDFELLAGQSTTFTFAVAPN